MKVFYHAIVIVGLIGGAVSPAFAESHDGGLATVTCAEFMGLDAEGQLKALDAMASATDEMAADEMASDEMASDEMAADEMATDEMAADEMATDEMAADEMASDAMMAAAKTCDGNPDMMVMDAMKSHDG